MNRITFIDALCGVYDKFFSPQRKLKLHDGENLWVKGLVIRLLYLQAFYYVAFIITCIHVSKLVNQISVTAP